ncbi:MAG: hypothetical protein AAFY57_15525 [Cyanobacteria bacterium J06642_2]
MVDSKDELIFPSQPFRGEAKPQNILFNSNLQEFGQRVIIICALESNGKIPTLEAYEQIKQLWKGLKKSKKSIYSDPGWTDLPELEEG